MASDVIKKTVAMVLFEQDITIEELIEVSGLDANAVKRAVLGGGRHQIHITVAETISEWLGVKDWRSLEWPREVTQKGRPALTGGQYRRGLPVTPADVCATCNTQRSCAGTCLCA